MSNKEKLIELVNFCTKPQQHKFKRLYSSEQLHLSIKEVVDNLPDADVDFAISQAERTIELNEDKIELKVKKIINKIR